MAFTKSLYYPWIDIREDSWIKNAALYWHEIQTIVPRSIENPYSLDSAKALQEAGILSPLHVNSDMRDIENLLPDVIRYLESEEGLQLLSQADKDFVRFHPEKMPRGFRQLARMHPSKIPYILEEMLYELEIARPGHSGFMDMDSQFAEFYMTLLATKLSERTGAGLITPSALPHNLSLKVKADAAMHSIIGTRDEERMMRRFHRDMVPKEVAQGLLVELMMEKISLSPDTPIDKIIKYRERHAAELGRFRNVVGELTSSLPDNAPLQAMQQHVNDLYLNQVAPSIDDLKKSLTGSRIKWLTNSWMKLAFISAGSSSMLIGMGLATTNALLVGAGISMVGSGILYNIDKQESIRNNPYSYLVGVEQELT
ncbi:DUF6236 family protein [Aeromonas salmonicida]|uniref:DUF6236 family protein n=2 Tax=Aeromonas TaxID=642 RepID=UPI0031FD6803